MTETKKTKAQWCAERARVIHQENNEIYQKEAREMWEALSQRLGPVPEGHTAFTAELDAFQELTIRVAVMDYTYVEGHWKIEKSQIIGAMHGYSVWAAFDSLSKKEGFKKDCVDDSRYRYVIRAQEG